MEFGSTWFWFRFANPLVFVLFFLACFSWFGFGAVLPFFFIRLFCFVLFLVLFLFCFRLFLSSSRGVLVCTKRILTIDMWIIPAIRRVGMSTVGVESDGMEWRRRAVSRVGSAPSSRGVNVDQ